MGSKQFIRRTTAPKASEDLGESRRSSRRTELSRFHGRKVEFVGGNESKNKAWNKGGQNQWGNVIKGVPVFNAYFQLYRDLVFRFPYAKVLTFDILPDIVDGNQLNGIGGMLKTKGLKRFVEKEELENMLEEKGCYQFVEQEMLDEIDEAPAEVSDNADEMIDETERFWTNSYPVYVSLIFMTKLQIRVWVEPRTRFNVILARNLRRHRNVYAVVLRIKSWYLNYLIRFCHQLIPIK